MQQSILMGFLFLFSLSIQAQEAEAEKIDMPTLEQRISALAVQMHSEKILENREKLAKDIEQNLMEGLAQKEAYAYTFSKIEGISVLQPEDKRFRIFTWEMYIDSAQGYQQFGVVHSNDGKVIKLEDKSDEMKQPEFDRLKASEWYGALYYNLQPFVSNNKTYYMLFGRDSYGFFDRRKIMEILYFDAKGDVRFGSNLINIKDGFGRMRTVNRYILQYSVGADVKCNYNKELQMIIFDHLINGSPIEGAPPTGVPDGSYCGLQLVNGKWDYVDKVFKDDPNNVLVHDENPEIIMRRNTKKKDEKDLFGRKKR